MGTIVTHLAAMRADPSQTVGTYPSIRTYLGAAAGDDPKLIVWLSEAIVWVNTKINARDLTADQLDLATAGIYKYMRVRWDEHRKSSIVARKIKTGRREDEFSGAEAGRIDAAKLAAWSDIELLLEDASLFSSGGGW